MKEKKIFIISGIVLAFILVISFTYAYLIVSSTQEDENVISTLKCLNVTLTSVNGTNSGIKLQDAVPITNQEGMNLIPYTFKVTNNCQTYVSSDITLEVLTGSTLNVGYIRTSLQETGNKNDNSVILSSYNIQNATIAGATSYKLSNTTIGPNKSKTYDLRLWVDELVTFEQAGNKTFKSKIVIVSSPGEQPFSDIILAANPIKTGADFNKTSPYITTYNEPTEWISPGTTPITQTYWIGTDYTYNAATGNYTLSGTLTQGLDSGNIKTGQYTIRNTTNTASSVTIYRIESYVSGNAGATITVNKVQKSGTSAPNYSTESGLYSAPDDYGTSYYYRGVVNNNNVIFGGYQWKIIRIDGRGNIKLIYNGTEAQFNTAGTVNTTGADTQLPNTAFNANYNDNKYVGYIVDGGSSTIKSAVDTFYEGLSAEAKGKIVESIYCNDLTFVSGTGTGTTNTNYGAYDRLATKKEPTFICPESAGKLELPVGLITADEVAYAGGKQGSANNAYYLYNASNYWTMSPSIFDGNIASGWDLSSNGYLSYGYVAGSRGSRPSITLSSEIRVTGTGSSTDPYKVV